MTRTLRILSISLAVLLFTVAFTQALPVDRRGNDDDDDSGKSSCAFYNDGEGRAKGQHGNVVVVLFSDSHYAPVHYTYLTTFLNLLLSGEVTVRSFSYPADVAAVSSAVSSALSKVKSKSHGPFSVTKTFLVAHGDAAAVVEAYAASSSAHSSISGLAFLGASPVATFSSITRSVAVLAGDLDGVSPIDTLAYRYLDESAAANPNLSFRFVSGASNAQFASGERKYPQDVSTAFTSGLLASRIQVIVFVTAWINYNTHFDQTSFAAAYNKAILSNSNSAAANYFASWGAARAYDLNNACIDFQTTVLNFLPNAPQPNFSNLLTTNYNAFVSSKAYVYPGNKTVAGSTYVWDVAGPNFGIVACKGKTQAGVTRGGLYAGVDTTTIWGPLLTGADANKKHYTVAKSFATSDAVQRFDASGRTLSFAPDQTAWANGPGFLASTGPFLFRSSDNPESFIARADTYRSPDVCPVGTPPQFCTADFLSAYYGKFVGARTFLKFVTYASLQD